MRISDWSSDVCSSDLRTEAIEGVVAHEFVEPLQLLVGEARIGLAHRQQLGSVGPAAERIIRIEARAPTVAALRIHHHAVGGERVDRKSNTSELQSLMRISYAVFCLKKKNKQRDTED